MHQHLSLVILMIFITVFTNCGEDDTQDNKNPGDSFLSESAFLVDGSVSLGSQDSFVRLSSPILPDMVIFQMFQNPEYYNSHLSKIYSMINNSMYSFSDLVLLCNNAGYHINIDSLNHTKVSAYNYSQIAKCGYDILGLKPYYVPKMISDYEICQYKLGKGWRLPTETEVLSWPSAYFTDLMNSLTAGSLSVDDFWANSYFSLFIYIRGNNGTVKIANLYPDSFPKILDLPSTVIATTLLMNTDIDIHLDNLVYKYVVLRCLGGDV